MAKTQTKISRWRRFFGWFGRHKVTAVFSVLVLAGVLFFAGSWVVLQVQIHFERERFITAQSDISKVNEELRGASSKELGSYCYYTNSPIEFVRGNRSCVIRLTLNFENLDKASATQSNIEIEQVLRQNGFILVNDKNSPTMYTLSSSSFIDNRLECSYDSEYYSQDTSKFERAERAPKVGSALSIDIICTSDAKAEYFPAITD